MEFTQIDNLLNNSISVKLVRANNAPIIIGFLFTTFKAAQRSIINGVELESKLRDFIESNENEVFTDHDDLESRAKRYLDTWADQGFLRKFPDDNGETQFELSTDTEKAFQWIENLNKKDFIGTESRFKDIFNKLQDIVENTMDSPIQKVKELEKKKKEIEEEIRQIKITQSVNTFNPTQIKERFYEIERIARELLSDFKQVEQNFKDIIRTIYEKQADRTYTKGQIVGYALDAIEDLKQKDQGRSFYGFWQFLINEKKQEELKLLVDKVYHLLDEKGIQHDDDKLLRRIKSQLYAAGKKVIESNKQLSSRLSKILSETNLAEHRKAMEIIAEVRHLALRLLDNPPKAEGFITIDEYPEVNLVMNRPLTEDPHEAEMINHPSDIAFSDLSNVDVNSLFNSFAINRAELENNITTLLKKQKQISLKEILEYYPVQKGLGEVLTYLSIASNSNKHIISEAEDELVPINQKQTRFIKIPQVIYTK
jgi:uncharacterized protein (UPF0297 family)